MPWLLPCWGYSKPQLTAGASCTGGPSPGRSSSRSGARVPARRLGGCRLLYSSARPRHIGQVPRIPSVGPPGPGCGCRGDPVPSRRCSRHGQQVDPGGVGADLGSVQVTGHDLPVRNVSPAANEHDRAGQTGKSPMTSSQRFWAPAVNGEGQTGASLPTVTAPRSCDTRYPLCAPELTAFSRCGGGRMVDLAHGLPGHVTARPELGACRR
jgi:hypothetical protein